MKSNQPLPKLDEPPGPLPNVNKNTLTVYLYNVVEDEWSFINAFSDPIHLLKEIERDESSSDCFFLATATESNFVYVSPKAISSEFQAYAQNLLKYKNGYLVIPEAKTHQICLDLLDDKDALAQLLKLAKPYQKINLVSYSASTQFYQLKDKLISLGLNIFTPEAPELENAWTVNFFGSKSGIRQLAQKSVAKEPDFIMPDGLICVGKTDAAKIAAHKYLKNQGVVIKTNKGCGGGGVLIFRPNDLPNTYLACQQKLESILSQELYWEKFPIVVEDFINVDPAIPGSFPDIEFKIKRNKTIEMLFHGVLRVTPQGQYYGMEVNEDILPDRLATQMEDTGYFIAEQYAQAGYCGHFDIDFIQAKNNKLFISESNTRHTGWTDVYKVVKKLIGKDWFDDAYSLSCSHFKFTKNKFANLDNLLNLLEPLLYSHQTKTGVIVNSDNILKDKELIYTIIAPDKKSALALETSLHQLLLNGHSH
jgi:hypothetical protein